MTSETMLRDDTRPTFPRPRCTNQDEWAAAAAYFRGQRDGIRARERDLARSHVATDGQPARWSESAIADEAEECARICEAGGTAIFSGLYVAGPGAIRVPARIIQTQHGRCWVLREDVARQYKRAFVPLSGYRPSRIQQELGLEQRPERAPAWAQIASDDPGIGLPGVSSRIAVYRVGDAWGLDAVPAWDAQQQEVTR